jgi:hypothetical protein
VQNYTVLPVHRGDADSRLALLRSLGASWRQTTNGGLIPPRLGNTAKDGTFGHPLPIIIVEWMCHEVKWDGQEQLLKTIALRKNRDTIYLSVYFFQTKAFIFAKVMSFPACNPSYLSIWK